MVTIVKNDSKLIVTMGQYENQFKQLGYQIASNGKGAEKKSAPISVKAEVKEEVKVEEKPVVEKQQEEKIQEKYGFKNNKKKGK